MVTTGSAEHQQSTGIEQESGDEEGDEQDREDAEEELQKLFEQNTAAVELFAFKQEFHGGESHAAITKPAENVDEDWQEHQRTARQEEGRVEEILREKAHGEGSAGEVGTVGIWEAL